MRWIDCNSNRLHPVAGPPFVQGQTPTYAGTPTTGKVLLWGDDDLEWMDVNEVRVERLAGSIDIAVSVDQTVTSNIGQPVFRAGILLAEELEDQGTRPQIDLYDPESYEEFEWMYLASGIVSNYAGDFVTGGVAQTRNNVSIPIDTRNRRKLGKKDALVLYVSIAWAYAGDAEPTIDWSATYSTAIRALLVSK